MIGFNPSQVQFTLVPGGLSPLTQKVFQSLTGSIHTTLSRVQFSIEKWVSIPHRFNSHSFNDVVNVFTKLVSIPHRFNSHLVFGEKSQTKRQFQSLTGSIHTHLNEEVQQQKERFQSLTGSIHTRQKKYFKQIQFTHYNIITFSPKVKSQSVNFNPRFCREPP